MASPPQVPPPITRRQPATVLVELETIEKKMTLADGVEYTFWTYNGTVPGPFVRVRVGDTVVIKVANRADSSAGHSIDLHAVTGPGGGAVLTQTPPGQVRAFAWKALQPGLYVYHCATPPVPMHIANGMYGLILVEPADGLARVDREFYVMQGEVYTAEAFGTKGTATYSWENMWNEKPEYVVFNGSAVSLVGERALKARVGERVRVYFGVGGPNLTSSFHVIGEIFDRVYNLASLNQGQLSNVQTVLVPPGGAVAVEMKLEVPGTYTLVDHALTRLHKGGAAQLVVEGKEDPSLYRAVAAR
ncbi:MAG TPA: copper-containing nitrite reductase, partial [Limnochordales bacterium]